MLGKSIRHLYSCSKSCQVCLRCNRAFLKNRAFRLRSICWSSRGGLRLYGTYYGRGSSCPYRWVCPSLRGLPKSSSKNSRCGCYSSGMCPCSYARRCYNISIYGRRYGYSYFSYYAGSRKNNYMRDKNWYSICVWSVV